MCSTAEFVCPICALVWTGIGGVSFVYVFFVYSHLERRGFVCYSEFFLLVSQTANASRAEFTMQFLNYDVARLLRHVVLQFFCIEYNHALACKYRGWYTRFISQLLFLGNIIAAWIFFISELHASWFDDIVEHRNRITTQKFNGECDLKRLFFIVAKSNKIISTWK